MSNALAIASVSWVLRDLLNNAIIGDAIVNPVTITVSAPDLSNKNNDKDPWLNLFLYNVTQNASWRNMGLPSRNQQGDRISNPPLALDLFYLLTAYGKADFQTEILLGYAMQVLHENPVLPREAIRNSINNQNIGNKILPEMFQTLSASDLADQFEMIKITPHQLSTEDISKLWTAFSTNYRSSVAYQVSVVLIESKKPAKSPLPVLTRGPPDKKLGHERGVVAEPSLRPPFPTLEEAKPPNKQIAVRMGEELTLHGNKLEGDILDVHFTHMPSMITHTVSVPRGSYSDTLVTVEIPQEPDKWEAGIYRVALAISQAETKVVVMTNELSILLAPTIVSISPKSDPGKTRKIDLNENFVAKVIPNVRKGQNVSFIVGDCEIPIEEKESFDNNTDTDTLEFYSNTIKHLKGLKQWVRLRVDGVESILIDKSKTPPIFDDTQEVEIT